MRPARGALALALAASAALAQGRSEPVVTTLTLFAGTPGGLWWSRDWGGTWDRLHAGAIHAILPQGPRVLAGGEEGLLVSEDFGQTWKPLGLTVPVLSVLPSRYPLADPTVFVGTASGLLKSEDGGRTFRATSLRGTRVLRVEWPGPELVLGTGAGVSISSDGAVSFRPAPSGLPPGDVRALALSSYYALDPVVFAGVGSQGVFRSSDGGRTWAASGLNGLTVNDLAWIGPHLYAATDRGLFRSEDAGARWSALGKGMEGVEALRLMFPLAPAAGAEVFLGTGRGVYRTSDGGATWQKAGLDEERVEVLATFPPPEPARAKPRRRR